MISETRSIYFRHILNSDGTILAESFFRIKSDAETVEEARADAAAWAGVIGEPLFVGGGGQNVRSEHPDFLLDAVDIKELDHEFIFDVRLTGRPRYAAWQLLPGSVRIEENGFIIEKKEYAYCGTDTPSYPHAGEITVTEDGTRMKCTISKVTDEGADHKKLAVTFSTFEDEVSTEDSENPENPDGTITEEPQKEYPTDKYHDHFKDSTHWRKASLYWTKDVYNTKIAELRFNDESYTPDWASDGYVLEKMDCTPDDDFGYFVEFTARKIATELVSVLTDEKDGTRTVTAVYRVKKSDEEKFSNLVGTVPVFASDQFIITRVVQKILTPVLLEITVVASERTGGVQLGDASVNRTEEGTDLKKADFFLTPEEADTFRESLQIGGHAEWAGENYFLEAVVEKETADGIKFELTASEIFTRMLSMSQTEKFTGFSADGTPCREVIYTSIWQVTPDDLNSFFNTTGTNAAWADDDAVITEISPKQKSPLEYRVTVKAERRTNPELHKTYNNENYESLSNRVDLDCELVDFRFSPKDCGYFINSDGLYNLIPGWLPGSECPIVSDAALHPRYINAIVKILRISETTYKKGSMHRTIEDMISWNNTRVYNGRIGNYSGSYLKCDLNAKEIYDSHGVQWTKITKIYDMAPNGTSWNPYHFRQIGN